MNLLVGAAPQTPKIFSQTIAEKLAVSLLTFAVKRGTLVVAKGEYG